MDHEGVKSLAANAVLLAANGSVGGKRVIHGVPPFFNTDRIAQGHDRPRRIQRRSAAKTAGGVEMGV